jgi:hypothetical protein
MPAAELPETSVAGAPTKEAPEAATTADTAQTAIAEVKVEAPAAPDAPAPASDAPPAIQPAEGDAADVTARVVQVGLHCAMHALPAKLMHGYIMELLSSNCIFCKSSALIN